MDHEGLIDVCLGKELEPLASWLEWEIVTPRLAQAGHCFVPENEIAIPERVVQLLIEAHSCGRVRPTAG